MTRMTQRQSIERICNHVQNAALIPLDSVNALFANLFMLLLYVLFLFCHVDHTIQFGVRDQDKFNQVEVKML